MHLRSGDRTDHAIGGGIKNSATSGAQVVG
jgi:hypothetical protein